MSESPHSCNEPDCKIKGMVHVGGKWVKASDPTPWASTIMDTIRRDVNELDCRIAHGAAKWQLTFAVGRIIQTLGKLLKEIGS